jgi:hypothetical protein
MFGLYIGYLLLGLCPILFLYRKHEWLCLIMLLGVMSNWLFISVGAFKFGVDTLIGILYLIGYRKWYAENKSFVSKFLLVEYGWMLLVGYFFMIFSPWHDVGKVDRTWTQTLTGKTITNTYRTFEPLAVYFYFYFIIASRKLAIRKVLNYMCVIVIAQFFIGIHDTFINPGFIKSLFHYEEREILGDRFTGMFTEPKHYGKTMVFALFIILTAGRYLQKDNLEEKISPKLLLIATIVTSVGILFSFSFSAITMMFVCGLIYLILGKVKWTYILLSVIGASISLGVLLSTEFFQAQATQRVATILVEEGKTVISGVPEWISGLEVFDAAGAAFFYKNPIHLIWGVGPNTIAIPASAYMSDYVMQLYEGVLNSPPGLFVLYYLSRGGIIGSSIFVFMLYNLYRKLNQRSLYAGQILSILLVPFWFACNTSFMMFLLFGICAGIVNMKSVSSEGVK